MVHHQTNDAAGATALRGGAMGLSDSDCTLERVAMSRNSAQDGGAIYSLGSTLTVRNSLLTSNSVSHRGGAISISGGIPAIHNTHISRNVVGGRSVWWTGAAVEDIRELSGGGGLFCFGVLATTFTLANTTLDGNVVDAGKEVPNEVGGGAAFSYCNTAMNYVEFNSNAVGNKEWSAVGEATMDGGGLHVFRSTARQWHVMIEGNVAEGGGGGMVLEECGSITMEFMGIQNNMAVRGGGGGIRITDAIDQSILEAAVVGGNTAVTSGGGGIFIISRTLTTLSRVLVISTSQLFKNKALGSGGGAIMVNNLDGLKLTTLIQSGNIFALNEAGYGSDIASDPRSLRLLQQYPLAFGYDEGFGADTMIIMVLDDNGEVASSFTGIGTVKYSLILDIEGQEVEEIPPSPYSVSIAGGKGNFRGMKFALPPGYVVDAYVRLDTGMRTLVSEVFTVELLPCPSGFYLPALTATTCVPCAAGFFSTQLTVINSTMGGVSPTCEPCDRGSFSAAPSSSVCTLCPPGTFAATAGSTECSPCQEGYFSGLGWWKCLPCLTGARCSGGQLRFQNGWWLHEGTLNAKALPRHPVSSAVLHEIASDCEALNAVALESLSCSAPMACFASAMNGTSTSSGVALPLQDSAAALVAGLKVDMLGVGADTTLLPCKSSAACVEQCDATSIGCSQGHQG